MIILPRKVSGIVIYNFNTGKALGGINDLSYTCDKSSTRSILKTAIYDIINKEK